MPESLESQVATLTALVAELQRRVAALEEQRLVPVRRYDGELVSVRVPDFAPPMLPESAPSGPRAKGGVAAIMGKWPGDETDEEIRRVLEELS